MSFVERLRLSSDDRETAVTISLVSGSHFVNHMYLVLLPPIFALLAEEFSVNLTALGFAVGVQGVTNAVFQLPFGYLSDNYGRGVTLVTGLTLAAAGVFTIASAPTFAWLLAGQALLGVGLAAHHPAHFPMLSAATRAVNRGRVFSLHGFAGNLGYAAAPAIITLVLLIPGTSWRTAFYLIGCVGAGYALLSVLVIQRAVSDDVTAPPDDPAERTDLLSVRERVRGELRSLVTSPGILSLALLALVTSMASWGVRAYAVVLLTDGYGVSLDLANTAYTVMFTLAAVVMLAGGELADRIAPLPILLVSYAVLLVTAAFVGALTAPAGIAIAVLLVMGSAVSFGAPARSKLTDALSADSDLGKSFALITVGIVLSGAVAPPGFGAVIETVSLTAAFYSIAALAVICSVLVVVIVRRYH